ncbi:MAG: hypothetical protein J7M19_02580 [Planctomycetes bacterium]|nr:hypothetical protein [Planctomycetota bacterium]
METREKIAVLKRLQKVDREIAHLRKMKELEPKRLSDIRSEAEETEKRLGWLGEHHAQMQRKTSKIELDIKSRADKISRLKNQMLKASTNREYQSFIKEVSLAEVEKNRVEEDLLETMIEIESFTEREKEIKAKIEEVSKKVEEIRKEVDVALGEIASREGELQKTREEVAVSLDAESLRDYERLFRARNGEAVVLAAYQPGTSHNEGCYVCTGCYMPLTHQMVNLLLMGRDLVTCKSCGRILYVDDDHKEPE